MSDGQRVAFYGKEGSFTQLAAEELFGDGVTYSAMPRYAELFAAVADGSVDFGVIPIENSLAGSLYAHYDMVRRSALSIAGEWLLEIKQNLLALPGSDLSTIKRVYSHEKALEQCHHFLKSHPSFEAAACSDTGTAAEMVAKGEVEGAAIGGRQAAKRYGLEILVEDIADEKGNTTRFFALQRSHNSVGRKGSFVVAIDNKRGSLSKLTTRLADAGLNLTKIESRPMAKRAFEYFFIIDVESEEKKELRHEELKSLLATISSEAKILGLYDVNKRF